MSRPHAVGYSSNESVLLSKIKIQDSMDLNYNKKRNHEKMYLGERCIWRTKIFHVVFSVFFKKCSQQDG